MKRFLIAICLSLFTFATVQAQNAPQTQANAAQIKWYTNYKQAVQESQNKHLPILLFFTGSDWCGWCKKMHQEIFSSPDFVQAMGNSFVFVDVDFPMNKQLPQELSQQNAELKQKYGITGYPTVIILDANQNFVAETGYRSGGGKAFADYLKQLIQKS